MADLLETLWHPEVPDCVDHQRDVLIGFAEELFSCGSLVWGPEHGPSERVGAVEEDRQHQCVVDAVQIEQRLPVVEPQLHGAEKARAPRVRQSHPIAGLLEQRRVLAGCQGQALVDRIEARRDRRERCHCGARRAGDAAALTEEVDEPLIWRDRARPDDDRGQVAVQH